MYSQYSKRLVYWGVKGQKYDVIVIPIESWPQQPQQIVVFHQLLVEKTTVEL